MGNAESTKHWTPRFWSATHCAFKVFFPRAVTFSAITGIASIALLAGCAVTHEYAQYHRMSPQEAVQVLDELLAADYSSSENVTLWYQLDTSRAYWKITSIDQDGLDMDIAVYVYDHIVRSIVTPNSRVSWNYSVSHTYERVRFADVTSIKIDRRPALLPGAPSTFEIYLLRQGKKRITINFSQHPNKYKEYLSALLVLCPNVK